MAPRASKFQRRSKSFSRFSWNAHIHNSTLQGSMHFTCISNSRSIYSLGAWFIFRDLAVRFADVFFYSFFFCCCIRLVPFHVLNGPAYLDEVLPLALRVVGTVCELKSRGMREQHFLHMVVPDNQMIRGTNERKRCRKITCSINTAVRRSEEGKMWRVKGKRDVQRKLLDYRLEGLRYDFYDEGEPWRFFEEKYAL